MLQNNFIVFLSDFSQVSLKLLKRGWGKEVAELSLSAGMLLGGHQ